MSHESDFLLMEETITVLEGLKSKAYFFSDDHVAKIIQVSIDGINEVKSKRATPKLTFRQKVLGRILHLIFKLE